MPIKTEPLEEPSLILTPMVDIVMLIMIFFMVSTEFRNRESQYEIKLPTVSDARPLTALPDEIVINVSQSGSVFIGTEQRNFDQLETFLREAQQRYAEQVVVVRGDGSGLYQGVMDVLSICVKCGIKNINLANQVQPAGGG